jgi:hypothetical protein
MESKTEKSWFYFQWDKNILSSPKLSEQLSSLRSLLFSEYRQEDCVWNVMTHAQKPDFVFRWNGRVYLNRQGRQFSRLLAGELCTSACRVGTARASLCCAVMWRLLVTQSILLFPLHFSSLVTVWHHISNAVYVVGQIRLTVKLTVHYHLVPILERPDVNLRSSLAPSWRVDV